MQSSFKTPKGTELPLLNLKGKPYLQVAHRIVWFREVHPNGTIETTIVNTTNEGSICRATIRDAEGKLLATGTKAETLKGFQDHLEKSESGAIGRALGFCGFGTQFTPELDEGERLADSPIDPARKPINELARDIEKAFPGATASVGLKPPQAPPRQLQKAGGEYIIPFGRHEGKAIKSVPVRELIEDAKWAEGKYGAAAVFRREAMEYLKEKGAL